MTVSEVVMPLSQVLQPQGSNGMIRKLLGLGIYAELCQQCQLGIAYSDLYERGPIDQKTLLCLLSLSNT
jgi:hypothetical protein